MTEMVENVYWVGIVDWSERNFHSYQIPDGATYNSYLIKDEKNVIIDSVKEAFQQDYIERIEKLAKMQDISYIISLHAEPDHSGAVQHIASCNKNIKIITSEKGKSILLSYYTINEAQIITVKHDEQLNIGKRILTFKMTPFQHWPEQMMCYTDDMILFSSDSFGQHLASAQRWADEMDFGRVQYRMEDYYANILSPFKAQIVQNSKFIFEMKFKYFLTAHGLCFRGDHIAACLDVYTKIINEEIKENHITIIYDTMYGSTQKAANIIAQAIMSRDYKVSLLNLETTPEAECALQLQKSRTICIGSPTLNGQMMPNVESVMMYLKALHLLKNMKVMIFGAFCWAPAAIQHISNLLKECNCEVVLQKSWLLRCNDAELDDLFKMGQELIDILEKK